MGHYFIRAHAGMAQTTQGDDLPAVEALRSESMAAHPGDWHSPIYTVPEGVAVRDAPIAVVFSGTRDMYLYPDGYLGPME